MHALRTLRSKLLLGALKMIGESMSVEQVCDAVMRDSSFYWNSGGGVTFTGGEPTCQPEFFPPW